MTNCLSLLPRLRPAAFTPSFLGSVPGLSSQGAQVPLPHEASLTGPSRENCPSSGSPPYRLPGTAEHCPSGQLLRALRASGFSSLQASQLIALDLTDSLLMLRESAPNSGPPLGVCLHPLSSSGPGTEGINVHWRRSTRCQAPPFARPGGLPSFPVIHFLHHAQHGTGTNQSRPRFSQP